MSFEIKRKEWNLNYDENGSGYYLNMNYQKNTEERRVLWNTIYIS